MSKNIGIVMNKSFVSLLKNGETYCVISADVNIDSLTLLVSKVFEGEVWTRREIVTYTALRSDFNNGKYFYL